HHHRVGHVTRDRRDDRMHDGGVAEHASAPGDPLPHHARGAAVATARERREAGLLAVDALLETQLALGAAGPEVLGVEIGMDRRQFLEHFHLRSRIELVGRLVGPAVHSAISASGTWLVEVPRSWRTPSAMCVSPSRYTSDRLPPCVFTGMRPPFHRM